MTVRIRTCIATRKRHSDSELLRVVVDPTDPRRVIPDPHRRLPGRGAWITPSLEAVERATKIRAFERALRISAPVDIGCVGEYIANGKQPKEKRKKTEH